MDAEVKPFEVSGCAWIYASLARTLKGSVRRNSTVFWDCTCSCTTRCRCVAGMYRESTTMIEGYISCCMNEGPLSILWRKSETRNGLDSCCAAWNQSKLKRKYVEINSIILLDSTRSVKARTWTEIEYLDCLMEYQRVAGWVVRLTMAESSVMMRDASRAVKIKTKTEKRMPASVRNIWFGILAFVFN